MERLYTCHDVAEHYGVKIRTVWDWVRSGKLPAFRLSGEKTYRFKEEDLKHFEESRRK